MDQLTWRITELLTDETLRERREQRPPSVADSQDTALPSERRSVRHAIAAHLVRWGLRLDPAAGEGLSAADLKPIREGGR
jgi:hypothetical protein